MNIITTLLLTLLTLAPFVSVAQPANDDCTGAISVTPNGSCISGTNVAANDSWTNLIGCQGGAGGPGGVHEDVWYSFVATGSAFTTTVTSTGIGGTIELTLMEPGPGGCVDFFTELASNCGASPVTMATTGLVIGNTYYIIVSSQTTGTPGTFDICTTTFAPPAGCVDNESCATAATVVLNASGSPGAASCVVDCNTGASPGLNFVGTVCIDMLGPTVWYTFTTDAGATTLDITLTSGDFSTPEFTLWTNSCDPWTSINGGCIEGTGGSASGTGIIVSPNTTYILAVSDVGGGEGNFNLCINQNLDNSLCNTGGTITEASSSDPATPVGGPYSPGEVVNYCYVIDPWLKENCNWLQGIVPTFGSCWDPSSFGANGIPANITTNLAIAGNETGSWAWYTAGAITYNNIVGSLPPLTPLPAGWFFQCNSCGLSNPNPNLSWGDGGAAGAPFNDCDPLGNGYTWTICFDLIAGPTGNCGTGDTDCSVTFKTYADGEIGGYNNTGCTGDVADVFPASFLCCPLFTAHPDATVCDSYTLPAITGSGLLGSQMYYDGPLGTGTLYVAGDVINYADYPGYPVTIYIYDLGSCAAEVSFQLTIGETPVVTFTALTDLCIDAGVQAGNGGGAPAGGVYSGAGVTDDGNGSTYSFDPAAGGVGVHIITYTVTTAEGCTAFATDNVEVFALPVLTFTAPADLCVGAGVQSGLGGATPTGGVYSGPGVTDDGNGSTYSFDPAAAGVGVHIVTYSLTDVNGCSNTITDNVEVFVLPVLTFTAPADLCLDAGVQAGLGGATPSGGIYSGPGVTDNGNGLTYSFDPAAAGVGVHILTYTYSDANGCSQSITDNVEVFGVPTFNTGAFTNPNACNGIDGTINLVGMLASTSYSLSYIDGAALVGPFAITAGASGEYLITGLGAGSYSDFTISDANCSTTVPGPIVLSNPNAPIIDAFTPVVQCGGTYMLPPITGASMMNPQYYDLPGGPAGGGTIIPVGTVISVTTTLFMYDENGPCSDEKPVFITINPLPTVTSVNGGGVYCAGDAVAAITVSVTGTPNWTIDYTLDGVPASVSGSSSPITLGNTPGVYAITNITDANCTNTASGNQTITINPTNTVTTASLNPQICLGDAIPDVTFTTTGATGIGAPSGLPGGVTALWSGNTITVSGTPASSGTFNYSIPLTGGCGAVNATGTITVYDTPVLDPLGPITQCGSYSLPDITGTNLNSPVYWTGTAQSGTQVAVGTSITASTTLYMFDGASGCSDEELVAITINPLPTVTSITGGGTYCQDDVVASIMVNVTGSANWTLGYTLNGSVQSSTGNVASPINLGTTAGVYVVTSVTDANCTNSASGTQTITINAIPAAPTAGTDATYCSTVDKPNMTASGSSGTITWHTDAGLTTVFGNGTSIAPSNNEGTTIYYVTETVSGCEGPPSMVIITIEQCTITIPTAFTPDNDGINDTWQILDLDETYPNAEVRVYNRWGNLIFEHKASATKPYNANAWDGMYNGDELPVASYYFIVDFHDTLDTESAKGNVSIIKN